MKNRSNSTKTKNRIIDLRKKLDLSQTDFWTKVGVTQSAGSRYENTDTGAVGVPDSIVMLVDLIHGDKPLATLANLRGVSVEALTGGK